MGRILTFVARARARELRLESAPNPCGDIVALKHVDLETVIENVKVLRFIKDELLLDEFNRAG